MNRMHETARPRVGARITFASTATVVAALCLWAPTPAAAQVCTGEAISVCGVVWNDTNNDGMQEAGETGVDGATVVFDDGSPMPPFTNTFCADDMGVTTCGIYLSSLPEGTYEVCVLPGSATPGQDPCAGHTETVTVTITAGAPPVLVNIGLVLNTPPQPGTGTPGYWKNHPWPVPAVTIGGVTYTPSQAIAWMGKVGGDKTITIFSSLVSAKLNVKIGNSSTCIAGTITAADAWMATYGPVGSKVPGSSYAWSTGEPLHQKMDAYNNGFLCAPHRN